MASESSLSPSPETLESAVTMKTNMTNGNKRKAEETVKVVKRARKTAVKEKEVVRVEEVEAKTAGRTRKGKVTQKIVDTTAEEKNGAVELKPKRAPRKKKEDNSIPLEQRTVGSKLRVGAHVSIAGGIYNAIDNVLHIGANAFALFMKNQRKWESPALDLSHAKQFIDGCKNHNIEVGDVCVPHGSYLINLAHPDKDRIEQAYASFNDDLRRCHKLGIKYWNFHPGNSSATTKEAGIKLIAEAINRAHKDPETGSVMPLLETMATLGNTIGGTFKDIADIIEHVENKDRIGVCLDTCHVFAAGYDLRTPEAYAQTMQEFDKVIGLKYLKALHVNDSKAPLSAHRDLHARIGTGYLGLRAFHNIVNDERLHGLPMVLETPIDVKDENGKKIEDKSVWAREIKMLEQLVDMDVESEQFKTWEKELHEEGSDERERIGDQVKRKSVKDASPKKKRGKKKVESEDEDDEE